jgi:hypothetical protein
MDWLNRFVVEYWASVMDQNIDIRKKLGCRDDAYPP